jgi:hypothetical protein
VVSEKGDGIQELLMHQLGMLPMNMESGRPINCLDLSFQAEMMRQPQGYVGHNDQDGQAYQQ